MKTEIKWWSIPIPENERRWDMRFLFERRDTKEISEWSEKQKESALRNLDDLRDRFNGIYEETKNLLNS